MYFYGFQVAFSLYNNSEDILPKLKSDEVKRIQLETDRVTKWVRMKEKWVRFKDSEKLRQRVYKGIPDRVRGTFWAMMMDLEKMKLQHKGKYKVKTMEGINNSSLMVMFHYFIHYL